MNNCLLCSIEATGHIIAPYYRVADHINSLNRNNLSRPGRVTKAVCMVVGGVIGGAITISLSPKMFNSMYQTNKTVDESTCTTRCQTDLGLKIGAGTCVALVDIWGISFGVMVGGEVGNLLNGGAVQAIGCVKKCLSLFASKKEAGAADQGVIEPENQV